MAVSADHLIDVIEAIYAAPTQDHGWEAALCEIAHFLNATGVTYSGSYEDARSYRPNFMVHHNTDPEGVREYLKYYHATCERGRYSRREEIGDVYYDYKYFNEEHMRRSEYYAFLSRFGGKYGMGTTLARPDRNVGTTGTQQCAVHYSPSQGHPDEDTIALFRRLTPHLIRANLLTQKVDLAVSESDCLMTAVDLLPTPMVTLKADLTVIFANQQAERVLGDADGITVADGRLAIHAKGPRAQILSAVRRYLEDQCAMPEEPPIISVDRPSGKRPYLLALSPISPSERMGDIAGGDVRFLALMTELDEGPSDKEIYLQSAFGLTPAESALASAIADGQSLQTYSALKHVSVETARWHLKSVFGKTDTSRQAELARLIGQLCIPSKRRH